MKTGHWFTLFGLRAATGFLAGEENLYGKSPFWGFKIFVAIRSRNWENEIRR
jgi:hypothetical protein